MEVKKLSALKGDILTFDLDNELQKIVTVAAQQSGFPTALITIVLQRTTFFRAYVGLHKELEVLRSTDTCATFCQYVVKNKKPLNIADTKNHPELPQQLIKLYGIGSYYGIPLEVDGVVIGSLCLVDSKPHIMSEDIQANMAVIAKRASERLLELSQNTGHQWPILEEDSNPKRRDVWSDIAIAQLDLKLALTNLYPVVKAVSEVSKIGFLTDAAHSYEDLQKAINSMDHLLFRLKSEGK